MSEYSMPSYFQSMPVIGKDLSAFHEDNAAEIQAVEQEIHEIREAALEAGKSTEALNESGQWTAMQRIMELVDEGTWCPLNSLYNPQDNKNGSVGIVKGLGRIDGKWAVIIASDNKKLAGAWVPGQADSLLRGSDTAKRLRIPLVYVLNCSGVKLDEQEKVYPNRRGGGTPFYRNSELNQMGVPVIVGIYGTNPAGGGYHSISPTILIAHQDANMAVGGAGIVGGMSPKGHVDKEAAEALIKAQKNLKSDIPGTVAIHYGETGFFREVYADEEGVLAGIRKYIDMLPAYDPEFFRVDDPKEPLFDANDLYSIVPFNQKRSYDMVEVLARLFDGSEFMEYKHGYGPEMITGLAKIDGLLVPMLWVQDTTGIDVGNDAERAELLGLGQSLIYSIQSSKLPMMEITLRKGTAAAHYVLGGPQGNDNNAFSIGTATTEIYVMHGETAAAAMYARRLVKEEKAGEDLQPTIDKMNALIQDYAKKSSPKFCAKAGMTDEIVDMNDIRPYIQAFANACYQNPESICPVHQMLLPRVIRDYDALNAQ